MLTVNDYNHLKLLYEKFSAANKHIKKLIKENNWDSVEVAVQEKDALIRQIIFFEKPRLQQIKNNQELNKIRLELIELEKQNIELVKKMKEELLSNLKQVKTAKKVLNAYEPASNRIISTFEIKEEV